MAATQCLKETSAGDSLGINKKINSSMFNQIKFQENKKRVRQSSQQRSEEQRSQNAQMEDDAMMTGFPQQNSQGFEDQNVSGNNLAFEYGQIKRRNLEDQNEAEK